MSGDVCVAGEAITTRFLGGDELRRELSRQPLGTHENFMKFTIHAMSKTDANAIAGWKYDGIYSFYDTKADEEDYKDLMIPTNWGIKYFSARNEQEVLVGYFSFEKKEEYIEIGLAMSPQQVGKGNGLSFVRAGLEYIKNRFMTRKIMLSVASFNKRAIKVFERIGFIVKDSNFLNCNGIEYEFLRMELEEKAK